MRVGLVLVIAAMAISCGRYTEPYLNFETRGGFDPARVEEAEELVRALVAKRGMEIETGPQKVIRAIDRRGEGRLQIFVFYDRQAQKDRKNFLWVSSAGSSVGLMFNERGGVPTETLDLFAYELRHELETQFGLQFCRENQYGDCDDEYARRDAAWKASVERRIVELD